MFRPAPRTRIRGRFRNGPGQARTIPAPSSGCITRTATSCGMWRRDFSGASWLRGAAKHVPDGRPKDVEHEFVTIFIAINENESWYLDDNIRAHRTDPKGVNKAEAGLLLRWDATGRSRAAVSSPPT